METTETMERLMLSLHSQYQAFIFYVHLIQICRGGHNVQCQVYMSLNQCSAAEISKSSLQLFPLQSLAKHLSYVKEPLHKNITSHSMQYLSFHILHWKGFPPWLGQNRHFQSCPLSALVPWSCSPMPAPNLYPQMVHSIVVWCVRHNYIFAADLSFTKWNARESPQYFLGLNKNPLW